MTPSHRLGHRKHYNPSFQSFFVPLSLPHVSSPIPPSLSLFLKVMTSGYPFSVCAFHFQVGLFPGSLHTSLCSRVTPGHTETSKTLGSPPLKAWPVPEWTVSSPEPHPGPSHPLAWKSLIGQRDFLQETNVQWIPVISSSFLPNGQLTEYREGN